MISISHERQVESERRLRRVISAASVRHLEGAWSFRRFSGAVPADALSAIRDDEGWCALVSGEDYGITMTTFSPSIENSGFVGWLSTTIKQRLGSGVFVICGDNPERGGIFDYLGYPIEIAGDVRALIDDLRGDTSEPLDLRLFVVIETSGAISAQTRFEFREHDGIVEATYDGGEITSGFLVGRRTGDRVRGAYAQLHADGQVRTGTSDLRLEPTDGQPLRLVEDYRWSDGGGGRNVMRSVDG
jgi:hypothetical protein